MPDFLVSAATGALGPVLNKLAALLSDEYKRFKGVRGEVQFLIRELEAMHAFLIKKSEEENPDAQEKAWMKEVRELSYDIEDSLDDFRVRVDEESTKPDGFIDKCKNLLAKTKARRRIAKEIEKLKSQVKEVSERHARYKQISNTVMNTSKVTVDPRALVIFEDASRLVGIDKPKQEVISFLMKDDGCISLQQPKMVSIVGIGGIGKTTLANRVYEELKDQFECQAFLSVSRNPDMVKILRTILSQVTRRSYCETEAGSIQQLIMEINGFLRTKRYIIVVDDVWDVETWDTIKYTLSSNSCGSVIITTTRIHDVAKACCSLFSDGWVYKPKPLGEQDSKMLFQNRIFGFGNECPENLKEVSDKILRKCGGLPLAIIAISGLLANKARNGVHSIIDWDQVETSIGHGLERDSTVEGMMGILSLSYFDLPYHLKACLLYLSIFPEDYEIDKKLLVQLWVAEGFIPAESTYTLHESGEKAFNELINRNLILLTKKNDWIVGKVDSCLLHDTVLDFIMCKSTEENFVTVHGIPRLPPPSGIKVRRLSIQGKTEGDASLHSNQNYANVRTFISFGFPYSWLGFRFVRVLDLMGCRSLLENHHLANIGELLQLRYLSLRGTSITELPEQIGALQYLQTLDLWRCPITQLPKAIVQLKRLVNLLIMSPGKKNCFPSGIKNMQALEELNSVYLDINAAGIYFEEIGDLTKMRYLDITLFSNSGTIDEESFRDLVRKMVASIHRLSKLRTLNVQFFGDLDDIKEMVILDGDDAIVEVPWCSPSLTLLVLKMIPMSRVPGWMKSLVDIEYLELVIKKLDQESLCILGDLPVLDDLTLEIVNKVEDKPSTDKQQLVVSNRHGYRSLTHFSVHNLLEGRPNIPMLTFEAGSMPKLERLEIKFDADITISVSNDCLDFGLEHLSQLKEVRCFIVGMELNNSRVEAAIKNALDNHPKHPYLGGYSSIAAQALTTDHSLRSHHHGASPDLGGRHGERRPKAKARHELVPDRIKGTSETITTLQLHGALAVPTDLSFTIHHHGASPDLGRRHGQQRRRSKPCQGATIRGQELVQDAPLIPDRVLKGTSGAASATSDVLGPRLIAAPQQQEVFVPPCFTFRSGSPPNNAEAEQQTMDCYKLSQHDDPENAFTSAFNSLSLGNNHAGPSATAVEAASSDNGAAPAPTDILGPRLIADRQHQGAFLLPCFTFSSRSPPNAEPEQQAMDRYKPSQHDDLANAFSSAFDRLSLGNNHSDSSATAVEAASSDTGSSSCQGGSHQEQQRSDP